MASLQVKLGLPVPEADVDCGSDSQELLRHAKLQSTHHRSHSDTKLYRLDDILLLKITESKQRRIEN